MKYNLLLTSALATLASSQTILQYGSGQLPTCAQNCQLLNTASYLCVPPVAPTSNQPTYDTCWCNSNYFATNLATGSSSSPATLCNDVCTSASDQAAVQNFYDNLCKSGAAAAGGAAATTTAAPAANTGTATTTGAAAATSTDTTPAGAANPTTNANQTWWQAHARWIAMAIVLIVAFFLILLLGVFLKRRRARKHAREAAMAAPVVWGPHQNQHHTGGINYGMPAQSNDPRNKGKGREMAGPSGPRGGFLPTASSQPMDYSQQNGGNGKGKKKLSKLFNRGS